MLHNDVQVFIFEDDHVVAEDLREILNGRPKVSARVFDDFETMLRAIVLLDERPAAVFVAYHPDRMHTEARISALTSLDLKIVLLDGMAARDRADVRSGVFSLGKPFTDAAVWSVFAACLASDGVHGLQSVQ